MSKKVDPPKESVIEQRDKRNAAIKALLDEMAVEERASSEKKLAKKTATTLAKEHVFLDALEDRLSSILKGKINVAHASRKPTGTTSESHLVLSDLHFGALLGREVLSPYGAKEEARRFASVVQQACQLSGNSGKLHVHLIGDVIQNQLHDPRDGAPLADQVAAAIHLLVQGIGVLAATYNQIEVHCSSGNHGRNTARHHERATHQKWDSVEQIIYFSLKTALAHVKNVKINVSKQQFYTIKSMGHTIFGTHGDTVMSVGSPGKSVNSRNIESLINRFCAAVGKIDLFVMGHLHMGTYLSFSNGSSVMVNGALIPSDEYAVTIGYLQNSCCQLFWQTDTQRAVYNFNKLFISSKDDKNPTLDSIIKAYDYE